MRRRSLVCVPVALALLAMPGIGAAQSPSPAAIPVPAADPAVALIATSLAATRAADSLHITVTTTGSLPGVDGLTTLDGAAMDADLDIANQALAVTATLPALGEAPTELRIVDGLAYLKSDGLTEDGTWMSTDPAFLIDTILSAIPGGRRILLADPDQARTERILGRRLARANATASIAGEQPCAAGTCSTVRITAPLEADASDLFGLFGGLAGPVSLESSASASPAPASMTLDLLVDTATQRLDSVVMTQGTAADSFVVTVSMGAYDQPVTIEAPPADQVTDLGIEQNAPDAPG